MQKLLENFQASLGESLPGVFGAVVILVVGWLLASAVRTLLYKGLGMMKLNERVGSQTRAAGLDLESGFSIGAYYIILLMTLLTVFNQLGLEVASQPIESLLTSFMAFIPKMIGGGALFAVGWLCGLILCQVVTGSLAATGLDEKVRSGRKPFSNLIGEASFWLVLLVFLPGVLGVFGLEGLLAPVQSMVQQITAMVPSILAAGIIVLVGWFIAKILRDLTTNLLAVAGLDTLGAKAGLTDKMALSELAGMLVYFFVFIPALIAGLNALEMSAIADPATAMLSTMMGAIPKVLAAIAILGITFIIAKPVSELIAQLVRAAGIDSFPQHLGIKAMEGSQGKISQSVGKLAFFFAMLFATIEAANSLGFVQLADMVSTFIHFGGQVLLGSGIIAIGLWFANLIKTAMSSSVQTRGMASFVWIIILVLVSAMGLRAMGLANDIVNMAFGLTLGAAAVSVALAFGLGGRDAAGKQVERWLNKFHD